MLTWHRLGKRRRRHRRAATAAATPTCPPGRTSPSWRRCVPLRSPAPDFVPRKHWLLRTVLHTDVEDVLEGVFSLVAIAGGLSPEAKAVLIDHLALMLRRRCSSRGRRVAVRPPPPPRSASCGRPPTTPEGCQTMGSTHAREGSSSFPGCASGCVAGDAAGGKVARGSGCHCETARPAARGAVRQLRARKPWLQTRVKRRQQSSAAVSAGSGRCGGERWPFKQAGPASNVACAGMLAPLPHELLALSRSRGWRRKEAAGTHLDDDALTRANEVHIYMGIYH